MSIREREQWAETLKAQSDAKELVKPLSSLEIEWIKQYILYGDALPVPQYEFCFNPADADRKPLYRNRMDIAFPNPKGGGGVYVECDGNFWKPIGAHSGGTANAKKNLLRQNLAASMGWIPLRWVAGMEKEAELFFNQLRQAIERLPCPNNDDRVPQTIRHLLDKQPTP